MSTAPPTPFKVKAMSPYQARNDTEVSLNVGEIYTVYQTDGKGLWWQTKNTNGRPGWFPASYTTVVNESQTTPPPPQTETPKTPKPQETKTETPKTPKPQQTETKQTQTQTETTQTDEDIKMTVKTVNIQSSKKDTGNKEDVPPPSRPPKIEKGDTTCYVSIQIVEAKNLLPIGGSESKTNPTAFIFRREILDDGKGEKLFNTSTLKKTCNPRWNEKFQINVNDAESEIIVIRFCHGSKPVFKGKGFLGEISFPLRGSVRDFDHPGYQFKFYPITGKSEKPPDPTGEVKIFIQYVDTKSVGKPTDFKQVSHIGWSNDGGFDIKNIPPEWKQIFQKAGIKKKDLENNPELAREVVNIMNQAQEEAEEKGGDINITQEVKISTNAPPPPPMGGGGVKAPPPPPMGGGGGIKAPPPPPKTEITIQSGGGGHEEDFGGGEERGGLLKQIQEGTKLKKVEVNENRESVGGGGQGTLLSILQNAVQKNRKDIEGEDEDKDEWSNDWDEEEED